MAQGLTSGAVNSSISGSRPQGGGGKKVSHEANISLGVLLSADGCGGRVDGSWWCWWCLGVMEERMRISGGGGGSGNRRLVLGGVVGEGDKGFVMVLEIRYWPGLWRLRWWLKY